MALIVGFVYDVEAQFVAELVEPGRIGIMAGPDRVEIVGLDHAQVLQRLIEAAHRPGHGVRFVAVDAAESDGCPVQGEDKVPDLDFAEAHFLGDDFLAGVHDQRVQNGVLRVPEVRPVDRDGDDFRGEPLRRVAVTLAGGPYCFPVQYFGAVRSDQGQADRNRLPVELKADVKVSALKIVGQVRLYDIVLDPVSRPVQKIDVPEDPREAEFVLVFQVAPVAPLENKDRKEVLAFLHDLRHVELRRVVGDLAVPDISPVQPDIEAGIHPLKIQEHARDLGIPVPLKTMEIGPAGIVLGNIRRIKRKRIADICVLLAVIAAHLP